MKKPLHEGPFRIQGKLCRAVFVANPVPGGGVQSGRTAYLPLPRKAMASAPNR